MSLVDRSRSLSKLLSDGVEQLGELFQNEIQLAQAELSEKVTEAGRGVAFLAAAAAFLIPVVTLILVALALWIKESSGISYPLAFMFGALVGAIIGLIFGMVGLKHLRPHNLKPQVTLGQLRRDAAVAKDVTT